LTRNGVEVISLFGINIGLLLKTLKGVDLMIFDIQDVGVRFYTYISSPTGIY